MFDQYKALVTERYKQRLSTADFSNNLKAPTPGKLKTECLRVYEERFLENDRRLMKDFFLEADENGHYEYAIRHTELDRFRPLERYLKKRTNDPDPLNIELLAWLIDFQPRPYRFDNFKPPVELPAAPQPVPDPPPAPEPLPEPSPVPPPVSTPAQEPIPTGKKNGWHKRRYFRWSIAAFAIAGLTLMLSIILSSRNNYPDASKQCMYWDSDHYRAVGCNEKIFGKEIIALDTSLLRNFKRITKPDTMTVYSVDRVFYLKINDVPECFTGPGKHPLFRHRNLKPLSLVMLRRYFGSKPGAN